LGRARRAPADGVTLSSGEYPPADRQTLGALLRQSGQAPLQGLARANKLTLRTSEPRCPRANAAGRHAWQATNREEDAVRETGRSGLRWGETRKHSKSSGCHPMFGKGGLRGKAQPGFSWSASSRKHGKISSFKREEIRRGIHARFSFGRFHGCGDPGRANGTSVTFGTRIRRGTDAANSLFRAGTSTTSPRSLADIARCYRGGGIVSANNSSAE
jgi:hypothetical protein